MTSRFLVAAWGIPAAWLALSRCRHWYTSKLTYIGVALALFAPPQSSAVILLAAVATIAGWAAFGYGINEIADRDADRLARKTNHASDLSRSNYGFFLLLTASSSLSLSLFWAPDPAAPLLTLAGLTLSASYSLPPIRLKERGVLGLLGAASAQWLLPVLAVSSIQPQGWMRPGAWGLALLGLAIGLRWIAVHQAHDVSSDRKSGVQTYASRGGSVWFVIVAAFSAELALLLITLIITLPRSILAIAALGSWCLLEILVYGDSFRERLHGYERPPLRGYYFFLFPVTLAIERSLSSPSFLVLAAIFLVLGWGYVRTIIADWRSSSRPEG